MTELELRVLATADEVAPLPAFEKEIWGADDEAVSVNLMVATISEGGVAIGAFEPDGRLVGSAYGFATTDRSVLHSHYLAVRPEYRGSGLGERLKRFQADWCLDNGYRSMRWTYDPLQFINAHLNLNKLGAFGVAYDANLYGALGGINGGLPSDRLTVQWWFGEAAPEVDRSASRVVQAPPVTPDEVAAASPAAFDARYSLREQLVPLVGNGWLVTGVDRHERRYVVSPVVG